MEHGPFLQATYYVVSHYYISLWVYFFWRKEANSELQIIPPPREKYPLYGTYMYVSVHGWLVHHWIRA